MKLLIKLDLIRKNMKNYINQLLKEIISMKRKKIHLRIMKKKKNNHL